MAVITIDDRDSSIAYVGTWSAEGNAEREYSGSTHGTNTVGSQATFRFRGSSISVFGTLPTSPYGQITSSYSIDGSPPIFYKMVPPDTTAYKQLFYKASQLDPSKEHSLFLSLATGDGTTLWLDYFEVTQGEVGPTSSSSSNSPNPPNIPHPTDAPHSQTTSEANQPAFSTSSPQPTITPPIASSDTSGSSTPAQPPQSIQSSSNGSHPLSSSNITEASGWTIATATTARTETLVISAVETQVPSQSPSTSRKNKTAIAVGSSLAGLIVLAVLITAILCAIRWRKKERRRSRQDRRVTVFPSAVDSRGIAGVSRFSTSTLESPEAHHLGAGYVVRGGLSHEKTVGMLPDDRGIQPHNQGGENVASESLPTYQMVVEQATTGKS